MFEFMEDNRPSRYVELERTQPVRTFRCSRNYLKCYGDCLGKNKSDIAFLPSDHVLKKCNTADEAEAVSMSEEDWEAVDRLVPKSDVSKFSDSDAGKLESVRC
jgi:hypothetical protein